MTARGIGRAAARATAFARHLKAEYEAGKAGDDADTEEIVAALRGVDWAKVRAATTERGADAAHVMKSMAADVDWSKVQPVAAKVSSALIAAIASGQLGVGGRLAGPIARAIVNERDLGAKVSAALSRHATPSPDFRRQLGIIEASASD